MLALICPLSCFESAYSVAQVVKHHLSVLSKKYKIVFITTDDFHETTNYEVRTFPRWKNKETYSDYFTRIKSRLEKCFEGVTHCIAHDVFFLDGFLPLNYALRELNPSVRYLVWSHSLTGQKHNTLNYQPVPNSTFVALTPYMIPELKDRYSTENIMVIPHFFNPEFLQWSDTGKRIWEELELDSYEIVSCYPSRLGRFKNLHKIAYVLAKIEKQLGFKSIILSPNSFSNNLNSLKYMKEIRALEEQIKGYTNIAFLSEITNPVQTPLDIIKDLYQMSNVFFMPSTTESFSLTTLEAGICGLPLIINSSMGTFKFFEEFNPLYIDFGMGKDIDNYEMLDSQIDKIASFLLPQIKRRRKLNTLTQTSFLKQIDLWLKLEPQASQA